LVTAGRKPVVKAAGFTLLELLVVLAIAGSLVALVPAAVSAVVPAAKARTAALDLASTIREARYIAISRSTAVDLEFDLESQAYGFGSDQKNMPRGVMLVLQERSGYVSGTHHVARHFLRRSDGRQTLRFYPDGSSSGLVLRIGPETGGGYIVTVDWLLGGASVERAEADAA
jgi:type II secretion system protein H